MGSRRKMGDEYLEPAIPSFFWSIRSRLVGLEDCLDIYASRWKWYPAVHGSQVWVGKKGSRRAMNTTGSGVRASCADRCRSSKRFDGVGGGRLKDREGLIS